MIVVFSTDNCKMTWNRTNYNGSECIGIILLARSDTAIKLRQVVYRRSPNDDVASNAIRRTAGTVSVGFT